MKKIFTLTLLAFAIQFAQARVAFTWTDSLLVYLPFNGTIGDSSGNNFPTSASAMTYTTDRHGMLNGALQPGGTGSFVTIPNQSDFNKLEDGFTITLWAKPNSLSGSERVFIAKVNGSTRELVFRHQNSGKLHSHFQSSGNLRFCTTDSTVLVANKWQHVAISWDGNIIKHYINGKLAKECDFTGQNVSIGAGSFTVGSLTTSGQERFDGALDDVRIYNRVFSESDVEDLMNYEDLNSDLVLDYNYNSNLNDQSSFMNDATGSGDIVYVKDRFDNTENAIYFDGVDDVVNIPDDTSYKIQYPFTVSAYINIQDSTRLVRMLNTNNNESRYYGIFFALNPDRKVSISITDGRGFGSQYRRSALGDQILSVGEWHHVVAVVEGPTDMAIYTDGMENLVTYSGTGGSTIIYTAEDAVMGFVDNNPGTAGTYSNHAQDDLKMWSKALDIDQIQMLYGPGTTNDIGDIVGISDGNIVEYSSSVFPNPAFSTITINSDKAIQSASVFTASGVLISETNINSFFGNIDLSNELPGCYFVKVALDNGLTETHKVSVSK